MTYLAEIDNIWLCGFIQEFIYIHITGTGQWLSCSLPFIISNHNLAV